MKHIKTTLFNLFLIGILLFSASLHVLSQTKETAQSRVPLELRYIANEGVLISTAKEKVLIDALFNAPNTNYVVPSKETQEKMLGGQSPFEDVTLVLVTHNHRDHFDAAFAGQFMENNTQSIMIAPADAVTALKENARDWAKIQPRVISLDLKVDETARRKVQDISIQAFRTLHSGDRESPANLMYLIEMKGWRIFHEGDSNAHLETFQKFGFGKEPIDLALVHFWFPLDIKRAKLIQEVMNPEHIALFHLPKKLEKDAPGKIEMVRKHYKDIFLLLPGMKPIIFQ